MEAIISAKALRRIINSTRNTVGNNANKQIFQYIKLEFKKGKGVKAVSIDGYSMSVEHEPCIVSDDFTAYIKPFTISKITKGTNAVIELVGDKCLINIDGSIIGYSQPDNSVSTIDYVSILKDAEKTPPAYRISFDVQKIIESFKVR